MRVIFFGTPYFSVPTLEKIHSSSHHLEAVITVPDKQQGRGMMSKSSAVKKCASSHGYDIIEVDDLKSVEFINMLKDRNADIFVVIAFKSFHLDSLLPNVGFLFIVGLFVSVGL